MVLTYGGFWGKKNGWQCAFYMKWSGKNSFKITDGVDQDDGLNRGKAMRPKGTFNRAKK